MVQGQQDQRAVAVDPGDVGGSQVVSGNEGERLGKYYRGLCMAMRHQGRGRLDLMLLRLGFVRERVHTTNTNMSLFDAISSQRVIRYFSAHPVSEEAVETMLNAAIHALSGGNQQPWCFVVIRDIDTSCRRICAWWHARFLVACIMHTH